MKTPTEEEFEAAEKVLDFMKQYYDEIDEDMQKAVMDDARTHVLIYQNNHGDEIK